MRFSRFSLLAACLAFLVPQIQARSAEVAPAEPSDKAGIEDVDIGDYELLLLPQVDLAREQQLDERRVSNGNTAHFAAVLEVGSDPWTVGTWSVEPPELDGRLAGASPGVMARWRLRIHSPGALSLSLAFRRFALPAGARLELGTADGRFEVDPFTRADQDEHGQLWTPPIPGDDLLLDLSLPVAKLDELALELWRVHHGYAGFGDSAASKAGDCHVDPACLDAPEWTAYSRAVGLVAIEGVRFCTGFLINNTAQDGRPLFATAAHCGLKSSNAASVVVMWDFERPSCDRPATRPESRYFQSGARLLALHRGADMALLELDDRPDPSLGLVYLGWDRSDSDPLEAVTIHHPGTSRKRISVARGPLYSTSHLDRRQRPGANHLFVPSWQRGTTEGGSSGAPLLGPDGRVVGTLHGGYAACGNREGDWFGRLSAAWWGPGPSLRLRDWLDPEDSQAIVLDPLVP